MGDAASSSDSDSESEEEKPAKKEVKKETKASKAAESSDSESESESEDEAPAKAKETKEESSDESADSDDSKSDSDDSDDSESEEASSEESAKESSKKRKADDEAAPTPKKSKTEEQTGNESTNLFVGNLSWNVDEEWLSREFQDFGELSGVRIVTERDTGRSRGFGYVEFVNAADAAKAFAAKKDTELDGRKINLDYASSRQSGGNNQGERTQARARSFGDQTSPESDTLFIGNIAFGANEESVRDLFAEHGDIQGIRLPTDPETGRPKGFGYVQFGSVDEARSALNALNGSDLGGRPVRLDFSTPRANNGGDRGAPRGGGFRGGRGGGRGAPRGGPRGGGRGGGRGGSFNKGRGSIPEYQGRKVTF
ncbi:hypothetical protein ASPZODRAFT_1533822 [Penicilliopsis zonata CBS 506.65]|uniref:RRM domain-containing protein n=1 Tax=Penicilliopsis zonata CBS 506.65 TaxID=1073090 RepID=A0A1L9SLK9_9EURO|nr:hypothetical protein ASPZODRAFT_1533822 [Penicilliopsis zonata CBS 506.65]OJJ48172.1 hypothetical protein ASPZODRAFT_1533822 [Penicilliopsis zonata CBS 506.65]